MNRRSSTSSWREGDGPCPGLGVCGGDGTVNAAAAVALRQGLSLAVLPRGTLNHFAYGLGVEGARDPSKAIERGDAVRVDVGRFRSGATGGILLNTLSLGACPEPVRARERWAPRIGGWSAGVPAALRVPRADRHPPEAEVGGRTRPLWLLFAGNGAYRRMPDGDRFRPPRRPGGRASRHPDRARRP